MQYNSNTYYIIPTYADKFKNMISFKICFKFYSVYIVVGSPAHTHILFLVYIDFVLLVLSLFYL
jgi:hypothetical protein